MTDLLQFAIGLVWVAMLHKTYVDGCKAVIQTGWVRVSETRWVLYERTIQ